MEHESSEMQKRVEAWREFGRCQIEENGFCEDDIWGCFKNAIVKLYFNQLCIAEQVEAVDGSADLNDQDKHQYLANKYRTSSSTIRRAHKDKALSDFELSCLIRAANVEPPAEASLPQGLIAGCRYAFNYIQEDLLEKLPQQLEEEVFLCLRWCIRFIDPPPKSNISFSKVAISGKEDKIVSFIQLDIEEYSLKIEQRIQTTDHIYRVVKDRWQAWAILERVLRHDWF